MLMFTGFLKNTNGSHWERKMKKQLTQTNTYA